MEIEGWDARALPCAERVRRWHRANGFWHREMSPVDGIFCTHKVSDRQRCAGAGRRLWRPWKDCNPVSWADFMEASDSPCLDGWEWGVDSVAHANPESAPDYAGVHLQNLDTGDIIKPGYTIPDGVRVRVVRRNAPSFEVPEGWEADGDPVFKPAGELHPARGGDRLWLGPSGRTFSISDRGLWALPIKCHSPNFDVPEGWEWGGEWMRSKVYLNAAKGRAWMLGDGSVIDHTNCYAGWYRAMRAKPKRNPAECPSCGSQLTVDGFCLLDTCDNDSGVPIPSPEVCKAIADAEKSGVDVIAVLRRASEPVTYPETDDPPETAKEELERVSGVEWDTSGIWEGCDMEAIASWDGFLLSDSQDRCKLADVKMVTKKPVTFLLRLKAEVCAIEAASRYILDNYRDEVTR